MTIYKLIIPNYFFRLEFDCDYTTSPTSYKFNTSEIETLLKGLVITSPGLKRLVLYAKGPCHQPNEEDSSQLEDFLLSFVSEMKDLVALCLAGFQMNSDALVVVKKKLNDVIIPVRPAFWYYIGKELPSPTNSSIPRMHYDEMVNPYDPYYTPPISLLPRFFFF